MTLAIYDVLWSIIVLEIKIELAPVVREMEVVTYMEKNEIVGYEPLVDDLKHLILQSYHRNIQSMNWKCNWSIILEHF